MAKTADSREKEAKGLDTPPPDQKATEEIAMETETVVVTPAAQAEKATQTSEVTALCHDLLEVCTTLI